LDPLLERRLAMRLTAILALALAASLGQMAAAQDVGTRLPEELELEDFSATKARSFGDFYGRAVLIEFFAYW
jgi:hypothetical protein